MLPNYRTADASQEGTVLTIHQKLVIASKDSFDYPLVLLGGAFAGIGQLANEDPSPLGMAKNLVVRTRTMSPGTSSLAGMTCQLESRRTRPPQAKAEC